MRIPRQPERGAEHPFAAVGENVYVDPTARILGAERITVGSNVRIDAFSIISAGEDGIAIGDHVHIAAYVFMAGAARIEVSDFAGISGRTSIYSSNDDYSGQSLTGPTVPMDLRELTTAPVTIGRHVVVGAGSVVLPGASIGDGAVVGAMSLVKEPVPRFAVAAGIPARRIRDRDRTILDLEAQLGGASGEE